MNEQEYGVARLNELPSPGSGWLPVRRHFGIGAFGVNGWTAADAGAQVIGEHDERTLGHEELYLGVEGRATFSLDGETVDAPAGTLVFVRDPAVTRAAIAAEPATTVLAVGAKRGETYAAPAWEANMDAFPLFAEGNFERARQILEAALAEHGEQPTLLYNLACAEARLGEKELAVDHVVRAMTAEPRFREYALGDDDLTAIRDDPRVASALAGAPDRNGTVST